ncbi:hypothetical protein HAX54_013277 [Datura stramonium]|uniref:Uncharacterized protein n=1 Tax=Datura stramonium TaxID=4076 RepID=A0ABS8Y5N7_DATST|nr:hypothetical protein [Datura stramonium]
MWLMMEGSSEGKHEEGTYEACLAANDHVIVYSQLPEAEVSARTYAGTSFHLRELLIFHDGSDEDVADENCQLPSSIRRLSIFNLKILSSHCWNKGYIYLTIMSSIHYRLKVFGTSLRLM